MLLRHTGDGRRPHGRGRGRGRKALAAAYCYMLPQHCTAVCDTPPLSKASACAADQLRAADKRPLESSASLESESYRKDLYW